MYIYILKYIYKLFIKYIYIYIYIGADWNFSQSCALNQTLFSELHSKSSKTVVAGSFEAARDNQVTKLQLLCKLWYLLIKESSLQQT